jgi:hypothetical protein
MSQSLLFNLFDAELFEDAMDHSSAANILFFMRSHLEEIHYTLVHKETDLSLKPIPFENY